jgi:hypothetical protein
MNNTEQIENIHANLVNGNRTDCVRLINEYGQYDFWSDYGIYLAENYTDIEYKYRYFRYMTISYFRITNR